MTANLPDVCMIGLGYIGLPTAAVIADSGCRVIGVDVRSDVVEKINGGEVHIEEHDLDVLVSKVVRGGQLIASPRVAPADVFVIAVPTPFHDDGMHTPDITYVMTAAEQIAPYLKPGNIVVLESTSPLGTTEAMRDLLASLRPDLIFPILGRSGTADVAIAYCPERVLPGRIIRELRLNDRAIGGITAECARRASSFYQLFVNGECTETDARSAEMTKLVENAFRDVNIAFANELSMIADEQSLDVWEIIRLANRHPRVNILQPGPGVGGHCIAVDPWFIVHASPNSARLIRTAREVNDSKMEHVLTRARGMIEAHPNARVACMGLSFKPDVDDFRESPALRIAAELAAEHGRRICVVEPYAETLPAAISGTGAELVSLDKALEECAILLLLVDHREFAQLTADQRVGKHVYDTRGLWS